MDAFVVLWLCMQSDATLYNTHKNVCVNWKRCLVESNRSY